MRKIFDIELGHYRTVNEDDNTGFAASESPQNQEGEQKAEQNQQQQQNVQQEQNKSVEQNEKIQQINVELDAENKRYAAQKQTVTNTYNVQKQSAQDILTAATDAASDSDTTSLYDKVATSRDVIAAKKKILDLDMKFAEDINNIELNHARKVNTIENNRLQILSQLNNEGFLRLPEKYHFLNESNVQQAKIYLNNLVRNEDDFIIRDMNGFKRVFKDSELVYGKDKTGYYVLCVDTDDFNKLYGTMEEAGYLRDEIFSTVMPQVLDRSGMLTDK